MHLSEEDIYRVIRDLLATEMGKRLGRNSVRMILPPEADFSDAPWHLDSIERMEAAAAVNEMFHLYETGLEDNLLRFFTLGQWAKTVFLSLEHHFQHLSFRSSGSTGTDKICTHAVSGLMQEAGELARIFSGRKRILNLVPCHHIYGFLFAVLLPRHLKAAVWDGRFWGIGQLARFLQPGDLILSFPLNWAYLNHSLGRWPSDIWGVSSTGPAEEQTLVELSDKGLARLTEIYGSSETGGIGFRHSSSEPYSLFSYWKRFTENNSEDPKLIRTQWNGKQEVLDVPDILQWEGESSFRILKRRDGAVCVAGYNVYPERISECIRRHPKVKDCAVRLTSLIQPARLKVFVIPIQEEDPENLSKELKSWWEPILRTEERPVHITFGKTLPLNSLGKPADWDENLKLLNPTVISSLE